MLQPFKVISKIFMLKYVLVFTTGALLLLSCTKSEVQSYNPNVLRIGNGADPKSLDIHKCTGMACFRILSSMFEGLVQRGKTSADVIPGVAKHWKMDSSGTSYTFTLRQSQWSDQTPLTSTDFAYAWKRLVNPKTAASYSILLDGVKNARQIRSGELPPDSLGVLTPNDTTFIVNLESPTPYFLQLCSFETLAPLPKHKVEQHGEQWIQARHFVNNGPFTLKRNVPRQKIVVTKNLHYYNDHDVRIDGVEFFSVDDINTELSLFRTGELDWIYQVPPNKIKRWANKPEFVSSPQLGIYMYRINTTDSLFASKYLRQAFAYSIDRSKIVKYVTKGGQVPAKSYIPPGISWYEPRDLIPYDTAKAVELFQKAGYSYKGGPGKPFPKFEILYNNSESHKKIAEVVAQMWEKTFGIEVELLNYEWKVYLQALKDLKYQIARGSWIGDYLDPSTFTDIFVSSSGNNRTGFANPAYDSLVVLSNKETDSGQRKKYLQDIEELLLDEMPIIPIYFYRNIELRSPRLQGISPSAQGLYSFKDVKVKE